MLNSEGQGTRTLPVAMVTPRTSVFEARAENVLKAPAGALFRQGDDWAVFVAENGKACLRRVRVGKSNGLEAEILDGLQVGNIVIVHPGDRIRNGVAIAPR